MRWVVDGMNVIGSRPDGWWHDRQAAMAGLVERIDRWAAVNGEEVTVVFEGRPARPITSEHVTLAHAPRAKPNAADDEIVSRVAADPRPKTIVVVTSDRQLGARVRALGAQVEPASRFRATIDAVDPGLGSDGTGTPRDPAG